MRRIRWALAAALAAALLVPPAGLGDPVGDAGTIDAQIAELRAIIESAKSRESVLTTDLAAAAEQIDLVESEVARLGARLAALEAELASHRARLAELRALYAEQTRRLVLLVRDERVAQQRLEERIVDLYQGGQPDEIEVLFLVTSLDELISQLDYLDQIARQDQQIAASVGAARAQVAEARRETVRIRADEAQTTALLAARTTEQRQAYAELVAERDQLVAAQADRQALLETVRSQRGEAAENLERLERAGAQLAEQIRASSSAAGSSPTPQPQAVSGAGFIWPVNGAVTSGYGQRWGRLHAGVDIAAGFGTTIAAAASGTVIHAGWLGGYGNLVVVDHGGGLSTAYAHQQQIYVSIGQSVSQGQALGEVGSTGNSTGPHLHFEVRINGTAVDPLGYL
jgi:murein DD-endopeptidase MepM/ murein hydrolase activator NlpD